MAVLAELMACAASLDKLKQARPYVIVGAFVVAAVVTPPDVLSQVLLAVPMWLLYELGILATKLFVKPKAAEEEAGA